MTLGIIPNINPGLFNVKPKVKKSTKSIKLIKKIAHVLYQILSPFGKFKIFSTEPVFGFTP